MTNTSNKSHIVLSTYELDQHWLERFQSLSPDLKIEQRSVPSLKEIPDSLWQDVEILYTFAGTLPSPEQVPRLRWIQLYSAGANRVLNQPLFKTSVIFTTTSGLHASNIAEYVMMVILDWYHHFPLMEEWQRRGEWPPAPDREALFTPQELRGKTIGIVGYGSIGRQVARLASAFGMRVLAMQRGSDHHDKGFQFPGVGDPEGTIPAHYYTPDQLHEMLSKSDVVVIAVPLTPQTREMFDAAVFRTMKPTAFLVNIARGDVIDEKALIRALEEKQIAGAALDVFDQEPLPSTSPLWHLPNVFISPHVTGLTAEYNERALTIFYENLRRYLAGEPLLNVVDKERGY